MRSGPKSRMPCSGARTPRPHLPTPSARSPACCGGHNTPRQGSLSAATAADRVSAFTDSMHGAGHLRNRGATAELHGAEIHAQGGADLELSGAVATDFSAVSDP